MPQCEIIENVTSESLSWVIANSNDKGCEALVEPQSDGTFNVTEVCNRQAEPIEELADVPASSLIYVIRGIQAAEQVSLVIAYEGDKYTLQSFSPGQL